MSRKRILVIAHDAGGANILASIVAKYRGSFSWHLAVAGPAARIFSDHALLNQDDCVGVTEDTTDQIIDRCLPDMVLTGTGWQTRIELAAVLCARRRGIAVASYLDHWTHYRERFGNPNDWLENLPDFVLVGDGYAQELACLDGFPYARLVGIENPYLEVFLKGFDCRGEANKVGPKRVLFLSEPVQVAFAGQDAPARSWAGAEFHVVSELAHLVAGPLAGQVDLSIRLHPSEPEAKYDGERALLAAAKADVHSAFAVPLQTDLERADIAIGIGSMALLAAVAARVKAIAWIPSGIESALPHPQIRRCRSAGEVLSELRAPAVPSAPADLRLCTVPFDRAAGDIIASHARTQV